MNVRWKRILSTLLVISMLASLLIVPASAADQAREWDLSVETVTLEKTSGMWQDLEIDATNGKWKHNGTSWTQVNNGTIIKVPVDASEIAAGKKAIVTLTAYATGAYKVEGQAMTEKTQEFICASEAGYVTIEAVGSSYLSYIGLRYEEAELPILLELSSTYESFDEGDAAKEVTVSLVNGTVKTVTATPGDPEVVTAAVSGSAITLTPGSAGATEVAVSVAMNERDTPVTGAIKVEVNAKAPEIEVDYRRIDVWELGGLKGTDTELYAYHNADWRTLVDQSAATFNSASWEVGDLKYIGATSDRFYTNVEGLKSYGSNINNLIGKDMDGYTVAGGVYANGQTGRTVEIQNVEANDKLVFYASSHNANPMTFSLTNKDTSEVQTVPTTGGAEIFQFVAPSAGTYAFTTLSGESGKPFFIRVLRVPPVKVTGAISGDTPSGAFGVKFINQTTKAETEAQVSGSSYTASLAPGFTYGVSVTGVTGYGPTTETKYVTPADTDIPEGKSHNVTLETKSTYTYSGSIVGFAQDYERVKDLKITMVPDAQSAQAGSEEIELTIDKTAMTFTGTLEPTVEYTAKLTGVDDYEIKDPAPVTSEGDAVTGNITVVAKPLAAASGKFVVLDMDDQFAPLCEDSTYQALSGNTVTALSFAHVALNAQGKYVEDGYVYPAAVTADGYTASLRAGAYLAVATANGYTTKTHVEVADAAVTKDLLFKATASQNVPYAADVYVGDASQTPGFNTVNGALDYIRRMSDKGDKRVTVHIAPGTYREQMNIDVSNVTFVNANPDEEVKLTWYYGIGYMYYSATGESGTESWYDPELAFDHFYKPVMDVSRWGCTVRVRASGFRAQDITFENSFNYYLTEEELADGVEFHGQGNNAITFARKYGVDVTSKAATERAAAIWVDTNNGRGDMTEFKNCKFLSSQDTFGTGKRMYLKDCYIEGMTDYICGSGDVVFDTCVLNWKGYSDSTSGGYITAPQTGNDTSDVKGYLFRNCYVSADTKLQVGAGYFGRPWGKENAAALFLNTTLQREDLIADAGWTEMSGAKPEDAKFREYGTTLLDGTAVDTSKRTTGTVLTNAPSDKPEDYFRDWTPEYYTAEEATVSFAAEPSVDTNGDPLLPKPGNTLTVSYALNGSNAQNDGSLIQWYRVKDGAEALVYTSTATAGKTYKVQTEDVGAIIKVTVTPKTISGATGDARSAQLANPIVEGYDDPDSTVDPELGEGVNIFLAGDSTVKDYSAAGMYNSGKPSNEGSWGEFLQSFLDSELVTVVNYANGGRSSRNFINEGSLDKIKANIGEGDYLFIQFGHNDSANDSSYLPDRYVPLGTPDANGIYPSTPGVKAPTPEDLSNKGYGSECYTWNGGGTYKWYLQQYIDAANEKGATAVLVTPVARMYYDSNGKIRPHHDPTYVPGTELDATPTRNTNMSNAYCTAVEQLYEENVAAGRKVLFIDGFALTEKLYNDAYAAGGSDTYGRQLMSDSTHSNKLGGMIEAALIAGAIQNLDVSISKTVKAPAGVLGETPNSVEVFTVNGSGVFTAYDMLSDPAYSAHATYWEGEGQKLFDAIAAKAGEPGDPGAAAKTALNQAITAAENAKAGVKTSADGSDVATTAEWVPESVMTTFEEAIAGAKAVAAKSDATQEELEAAESTLKAATTAFESAKKPGAKEIVAGEHTLWLVGDSTVCSFTDPYYYPRYGYGTQIGNYLDGTYEVKNLALSGRSSKSYLGESNYATLFNAETGIKQGDTLIIGFGHNDEKAETARYTNPNGDWQTAGSFAESLWTNYVAKAQAKGAEVILCTPIVRLPEKDTFSNADLHITASKTTGGVEFPGGDYPGAIIQLGKDKNIPVVDLTALTKQLYLDIGFGEALYLHAWTSVKEASVDSTHLNIYGAKLVAYLLADALQNDSTILDNNLGKHVDLSAGKPTKAKDLVENPDYTEPDYDPNLPDSQLWQDYTCVNPADGKELTFKGTAFGDIGGVPAASNFTLESDTNGNMHIAIKGNKGKIANNSDGIAMYYLKLPAGTIFEFTAKATLNQIDDNGQVAFGLMARDDMYIDTFDASIKSDYVAAGTLGGANACNSFFRQNGALGGREGFVNGTTIEAGQSYTLSIVSNSDGYACTFGNEPTQSGGYDFQLTSVDSENIYIGMFAVRNIDVTFSDISLKIIEEDPGGNEPGAVDTTALEAAIRAAEAAADAVEVSVDGSDVLKTDKWVTQAEMKALTDAIAEAKAVAGKAGAAQTEVDAAKDKLTSAIAAFESANKVGAKEEQEEEPVPDTVDKAELQSAVEAAKKAAEAVKTSEKNGSDVSKSAKWVTPDDMETYQKAIEAAEAVVGKEDATADEAADALAALAKATEVFEQAQKSGTKSSSSGFGGSSTSSGSSTSGSTTTTTGQDGSTTTTTTDRDGTKTETVSKPDGTTTETVTKPDGTVTETITEANGTKTETVTEPDGTVTETVTKTDGSIAEKVTGLDGTVTETKTKADGNKTETVKAASGDVTVTATTSDGEVIAKVEIPAVVPALDYSFEDVPTGHWAESAINTMAALSVVNGVSEENHVFDMNSNITRGAMAQILFNLSQGKEGKTESFGDVAEGAWYADAVAWAADAGVVAGYSDNVFAPEDSITREQLVVMLYRYADLMGLDLTAGSDLSRFTDSGSVSGWASSAMTWAVDNGLIQGKGENNLDPSASATRAETAVVLQRFLDLVSKKL